MNPIGSVPTHRRPPRSEPDAEFADLPPVLVQVGEMVRPAGLMWKEISSVSAVYAGPGERRDGTERGGQTAARLKYTKKLKGE